MEKRPNLLFFAVSFSQQTSKTSRWGCNFIEKASNTPVALTNRFILCLGGHIDKRRQSIASWSAKKRRSLLFLSVCFSQQTSKTGRWGRTFIEKAPKYLSCIDKQVYIVFGGHTDKRRHSTATWTTEKRPNLLFFAVSFSQQTSKTSRWGCNFIEKASNTPVALTNRFILCLGGHIDKRRQSIASWSAKKRRSLLFLSVCFSQQTSKTGRWGRTFIEKAPKYLSCIDKQVYIVFGGHTDKRRHSIATWTTEKRPNLLCFAVSFSQKTPKTSRWGCAFIEKASKYLRCIDKQVYIVFGGHTDKRR